MLKTFSENILSWKYYQLSDSHVSTLWSSFNVEVFICIFCQQDIAQMRAPNVKAFLSLNECMWIHTYQSLKTLEKNSENDRVRNQLYSTTICNCTFYWHNQSACPHISLKKEGDPLSIFKLLLFPERYHKMNIHPLGMKGDLQEKINDEDWEVPFEEFTKKKRMWRKLNQWGQ